MTRPRPGIGSELLAVALILVCLTGTWLLVITMHRRGAAGSSPAPVASPIPAPKPAPEPVPVVVVPTPPPAPVARRRTPRPVSPPPEDSTKTALARLAQGRADQILAAESADRRAETLERARQAALADSERWKRREMLVKTQMDSLAERAQRLESEVDALALERDVLAQELDSAKAALTKARTRASYAVLPNKGQNGTWRRPIIIECRNGTATLQPHGPTYSMVEMSGVFGLRSAPIVAAVAREVVKAQAASTPDGSPAVPYIFFVIRPDGIRPYYEARGRLESLGIAFGYELVDQNWEIDFPDLDNLDEWDGSPPRTLVSAPTTGAVERAWPKAASRSPANQPPDSFVWPAPPRGSMAGGGPGDALPDLPGSGGSGPGSGGGAGGPAGRAFGDFPGGNGFARNGVGSGGIGTPGSGPGGMPGSNPDVRNGLGSSGNGVDPRLLDSSIAGTGTGTGAGLTGGMPDGTDPSSRPFGQNVSPGGTPSLTTVSPDGLPSLDSPGGPGGAGAPGLLGQGSASGSAGKPPRGAGVSASGLLEGSGGAPPPPGPANGSGSGQFQWPSRTNVPPATSARAIGGIPPAATPPGSSGSMPAQVTGGAEVPPDLQEIGLGSQGDGTGMGAPGSSTGAQRGGPTSGSQSTSGGSANASQSETSGASGATGQPTNGNASPVSVPIPLPMSSSSNEGSTDIRGMDRSGRAGSPDKQPLRIDTPFEIVVVCEPDGIVIHPGGYRISPKLLKGKTDILAKELRSVVRTRQLVDPMIRPRPSIRFLVEPGGEDTYFDARRQTVLSGLDWPVTLQLGDTNVLSPLARESF